MSQPTGQKLLPSSMSQMSQSTSLRHFSCRAVMIIDSHYSCYSQCPPLKLWRKHRQSSSTISAVYALSTPSQYNPCHKCPNQPTGQRPLPSPLSQMSQPTCANTLSACFSPQSLPFFPSLLCADDNVVLK